MKTGLTSMAGLLLALALAAHAQAPTHDDQAEHAGESPGALTLDAAERMNAGIAVDAVQLRALEEVVRLPAEVKMHGYRSAVIAPRISAQIVARHVTLGAQVEAGQRLVTLSSVAMAEAQAAMLVAETEWRRVQTLGRDTVSERRYTEAQVAQQQAYATVVAYGMTEAQTRALMSTGDVSRATGAFDLLAPQSGTVLSDRFVVGEVVESGRVLFEISDETVLWVEARAAPVVVTNVGTGAAARVSVDGRQWLPGRVVQHHHQLDETTRTQAVRMEVENSGDRLHPGQFVEAEIVIGAGPPVLAVPTEAVVLLRGEPTVFRFTGDDSFHAELIEPGAPIGAWTPVLHGLVEGDEIAVTGVFHLKSLSLKSAIGEGHVH